MNLPHKPFLTPPHIFRPRRGKRHPPPIAGVITSACGHTDAGLHPRLWSYRPFRAATRWLRTASVAMARAALKGRRLQPGVSTPGTQNKKNENSPVGAKEKKHGKFIGKNRHPPRVPCEKHGYSNAERGSSAHFPIYRRCHQGHGRLRGFFRQPVVA